MTITQIEKRLKLIPSAAKVGKKFKKRNLKENNSTRIKLTLTVAKLDKKEGANEYYTTGGETLEKKEG